MTEYVVLHPQAQEAEGFKHAVRKPPIGFSDDLDEAKRIAHAAGGGAVFRMRMPWGDPEVPGGKQPYLDELLDSVEKLEWKCCMAVVLPGTIASKVWGLEPE
jgi:hypothetical protein